MANGFSGAIMPLYMPPGLFSLDGPRLDAASRPTSCGSARSARRVPCAGAGRSGRARPRNRPTVFGEQTSQAALTSVGRDLALHLRHLEEPDLGLVAAAIASLASCDRLTEHSMFDWPEPTQTSPMRMSSSSILFLPVTVKGRSKPATNGRFKTSHFEERMNRRVSSRANLIPLETADGESSGNGSS